jgi:prepilin-type N-terminal cleavage/methylation domain-containing protein
VKVNLSQLSSRSKQRGFTFLELVVVVSIISILGVVALNYYYKLMVDVERTSMERDLGVMRSAIGIQVAGHFVSGNMAGLEKLVDSNPMDLLAEKPSNYLGVISHYKVEEIEKGSWFATNGILKPNLKTRCGQDLRFFRFIPIENGRAGLKSIFPD